MAVSKIGVLGAGQMGAGIAQVAASIANKNVILYDLNKEALDRGKGNIEKSLSKLESKGKIEKGTSAESLKRIETTSELKDLSACDFIIEAVVEREDIKCELFRNLSEIVSENTVFASNTSSIPITKLGTAVKKPEHVIGMHFMNPVPIMTLVEVIRSPLTNDQTYKTTCDLAAAMNKTTVCSKDFPGFIVNRILMPMINEACFAVHESLATPEDIDTAMKLGCNQPMGPLALADFIGLDTCLYILEVLHRDLGDPKFRPCPLLKQYVTAGLLGKKSGKGFFTYE